MDAATIRKEHAIYVVPIRFVFDLKTLECWLPLADKEPVNKKIKTGDMLAYRSAQKSRGGYYQMNNGRDVHCYMFDQQGAAPSGDDEGWEFHYSHLCHHWWCCNPSHIVREPSWINIFRKRCKFRDGHCDCDGVSHPRYSHAIKKCIWFNATLVDRAQHLDKGFLDRMPYGDRKRIQEEDDVYSTIKSMIS